MSKEDVQSQAEASIKEYMEKQNRPYSVVDVVSNLRNEFGKTLVAKCLDRLVESGDLKQKTLSKQKIYFPNQDNFPTFNEAEIKAFDGQIQQETDTLQNTLDTLRKLQTELNQTESSLTTAELKVKFEELTKECDALQERTNQLKTSATKVNPDEIKKACQSKATLVSQWRRRKRMAEDILNAVLENCPKKKKDLLEEVGVETDEEANVKLP